MPRWGLFQDLFGQAYRASEVKEALSYTLQLPDQGCVKMWRPRLTSQGSQRKGEEVMRKHSQRSSDCYAHVAMFGVMLCGLTLLIGCDPGQICDIVPELCNPPTPCPYENDGECDDGRPGADTDLCDFGTDPDDCEGPVSGGAANLTGTWRVSEVDNSNCGGDGSITGNWEVTDTGRSVTLRSGSRNITLSGTHVGDRLNLQGSFPEDGGTTTVTSSNITVGPTGNTISGTETWRWSDGFESCSGTTTISGSRL